MTAWLRAGFVLLVAWQAGAGLWAAVFPEGFFGSFPVPSHAWVSMFPPYNEHLVRDFGLALLQCVPVTVVCIRYPERRFVRAVLIGLLLFSVSHALFHEAHVVRTDDLLLQRVFLLFPVVLAVVLLYLSWKSPVDRPDHVEEPTPTAAP
ncbi:hypothetical protein [Saccharothrix obliqua]|uniref:hypothetical protein n=1 Tax=Saccharothrix obliqua TaxID=2861747 RepID=UPI001C5EBF98|nr:hypothetical protein [Saccharothrix obliqua]MBW4718092.1 hypothetical protein [Saccharothrix obliqua]